MDIDEFGIALFYIPHPAKLACNLILSERFRHGHQLLFRQQYDHADGDNCDDDVRHVEIMPFIPNSKTDTDTNP